MQTVTDFVTSASISDNAQPVQEIKKATPSSAYQALLRLEKTVGELPLWLTWHAIPHAPPF